MSASHRGSPIATITTSVLAALVLYVGTWPPIDIRCSNTPGTLNILGPPPWTHWFYYPLHSMCDFELQPVHENPLERYYAWWMDRIAVTNTYGMIVGWK